MSRLLSYSQSFPPPLTGYPLRTKKRYPWAKIRSREVFQEALGMPCSENRKELLESSIELLLSNEALGVVEFSLCFRVGAYPCETQIGFNTNARTKHARLVGVPLRLMRNKSDGQMRFVVTSICGQLRPHHQRGVRRDWTGLHSFARAVIQSLFVQHSETESHTGDDAAAVVAAAVKEATTNTAATAAVESDEEALLNETRVYSFGMQHFLVLKSTAHLRIGGHLPICERSIVIRLGRRNAAPWIAVLYVRGGRRLEHRRGFSNLEKSELEFHGEKSSSTPSRSAND